MYITKKASEKFYYLRCLKSLLGTYWMYTWVGYVQYVCTLVRCGQLPSSQIQRASIEDCLTWLTLSRCMRVSQYSLIEWLSWFFVLNFLIHNLLTLKRETIYNLRQKESTLYQKCHTNLYKNSFMPWCLFNGQWNSAIIGLSVWCYMYITSLGRVIQLWHFSEARQWYSVKVRSY